MYMHWSNAVRVTLTSPACMSERYNVVCEPHKEDIFLPPLLHVEGRFEALKHVQILQFCSVCMDA